MGMFNLAAPENAQDLLFSRSDTGTKNDESMSSMSVGPPSSKLNEIKKEREGKRVSNVINSDGVLRHSLSDTNHQAPFPMAPASTSSNYSLNPRSYSEQPQMMSGSARPYSNTTRSQWSSAWDNMFRNDFRSGNNGAKRQVSSDYNLEDGQSGLHRHSSGGSSSIGLTRHSSGGSSGSGGGFSVGSGSSTHSGMLRRASAPTYQNSLDGSNNGQHLQPQSGSTTTVKAMRTNRRRSGKKNSGPPSLPTIDANSTISSTGSRNIDTRLLETGFE